MPDDYDLTPINYQPRFTEPFAVPTEPATPEQTARMREGVKSLFLNTVGAPGVAAQPVVPETPGMLSDVDVARQIVTDEHLKNWAPQQALNMVGQGAPMAVEGSAGLAGGKLRAAGEGVAPTNNLGFHPDLRVMAPETKIPEKPLIVQTTTNANAEKQLAALDTIQTEHPDPAASPEDWARMHAYAFGTHDVPVPPYAFIRDINSDNAANNLRTLTPGQIADADHGFENAAKFRQAYESGQVSPEQTGKLFLWSFLSRGVSPYTQESMFLDAYHGIDPWIKKAVAGDFTEKDLPAYRSWASTVAPAGSGQPGAGTAHNLNAFGQNFLLNMAKPWKDEPSRLQYLHDLMSDPNMTGRQIRREFSKFGEGTGIDNKVVSFTQLVAGHPDVMVLDRVQMRALWDDGRFADRNIYDGVRDAEGKIITGTALANLTYGTRGLLQYEAIENALANRIKDIYTAVGRPQDASIGRYHWESWVAHSQQEASHGTLGSILDKSIAKVTSKQGEYGAYEYGTRYGRDENGHPFFVYRTPSGQDYSFNVPAFRSFLEEIKKPATGVVPTKFKVTESGNAPWYERPEVNKERLDAIAHKWADRPANGGRQLSALAAEQQNAGGVGGHGLPAAPGYQGLDPPYARGGAVNYTLRPVAYNPFKDDAKLSHAPRRAEHAKGGAVKRDEGGEVVDYDYDAAKAAGVTPDERGHMPDTYKLPNHMTFSDESVYHGQNGEQGGRWDSLGGDRWAFTPGTTNLRYHSIPEMQQYFQRVEPDSLLVLPNAGVTGMARGGRAKLAHVSVGYVARSTHLPQKCGGCTMFMPPSGCTLVQSPIKAGGWCRRFNAKAE